MFVAQKSLGEIRRFFLIKTTTSGCDFIDIFRHDHASLSSPAAATALAVQPWMGQLQPPNSGLQPGKTEVT